MNGSGTAGAASINAITPRHGFLGRTVEVQISGDNTTFDAGTTVDFGAGITVDDVALVSPTQLVATITIADAAATGDHDVTVHAGADTLVATGGYAVDPSLAIEVQGGPLLQGDIATVTMYSLDTIPLGSTMPAALDVPGMFLVGGSNDAFTATYQAYVDTSAAPGNRPLVIENEGVGNTKFVADQTALAVGARTLTAITLPYSGSVVFDTRSKAFTVQTSSLGILSASATGIGGQLIATGMLTQGSPERGVDVSSMSAGVAVVTRATATTTNLVIGGNLSTGNDAAHTLTLGAKLTTVSALTPESASPHGTTGSPQVMTSPSIVDGALSTGSEVDFYSISVPANGNVELTISSPNNTVDVSLSNLGQPIVDFIGSASTHWHNSSASAANYMIGIIGAGTATNYTLSFRLY